MSTEALPPWTWAELSAGRFRTPPPPLPKEEDTLQGHILYRSTGGVRYVIVEGEICTPFKAIKKLGEYDRRIIELYKEAKSIKDDKSKGCFCANSLFYKQNGFKDKIVDIVGHCCSTPKLQGRAAYDMVYNIIYRALPDCRNCSCF